MNAIEMIKKRRSVRKFKDEKVSRELMTEIVDSAKWAPSWPNFQIVRYTIMSVIDADNISEIANLAEEETVAALIVFGFQEADVPATDRKDVTEILRFVD